MAAAAAPVAAAAWGVFWFKEFKGAPTSCLCLLFAMFLSYGAAITTIAMASDK